MSYGFENAPEIMQPFPAGTNLSGWHVDSGEVDILYPGFGFFGFPDTGRHCLDLSGNQAGTISRSFSTIAGKDYLLTFAYSKNPSPANPPGFVARANINITGQSTMTLSYGSPNTYSNLNWAYASFLFTASSPSTSLQFVSLNPGNAGMYLDSVVVRQVESQQIGAPLVEWNDRHDYVGLHFWTSVGGQGNLLANLVETNNTAHLVTAPSGIILPNVWQHVALTFSKTNGTVIFYVNGTNVYQQTVGALLRWDGFLGSPLRDRAPHPHGSARPGASRPRRRLAAARARDRCESAEGSSLRP